MMRAGVRVGLVSAETVTRRYDSAGHSNRRRTRRPAGQRAPVLRCGTVAWAECARRHPHVDVGEFRPSRAHTNMDHRCGAARHWSALQLARARLLRSTSAGDPALAGAGLALAYKPPCRESRCRPPLRLPEVEFSCRKLRAITDVSDGRAAGSTPLKRRDRA